MRSMRFYDCLQRDQNVQLFTQNITVDRKYHSADVNSGNGIRRYTKLELYFCTDKYSRIGELAGTYCSPFHHCRRHSRAVHCILLTVRCMFHCHNGTDSDYTLQIIAYKSIRKHRVITNSSSNSQSQSDTLKIVQSAIIFGR